MRCKSSRIPGIGFGVAVLSLGLAGCPADSDDTQVAAGPTSADPVSKTTQALQSASPSGRTSAVAGGGSRLYGASLSTGATPAASAQAFQRAYAASRGIDPNDLVPQDLKQGRAVATSAPQGNGLMYDQSTGQPKFWLYRAGQTKNGIRVYRAQLLTLVRNAANNPVVWSSSSLHNLSGFVAPAGLQARAPDPDKSLASIPSMTDYRGKRLPPPQAITSLSPPELVVFAGTKGREVAPRMAVEYTATTSPTGSWHIIADASTGDVLSVESLAMYATITGTVQGNVTPGSKAMECFDAVSTPFPFAEVDSSGGENGFTDGEGAYTLPGDFAGPVDVSSPMVGLQFYVISMDPSVPAELLTTSVVPPVTVANFLHNTALTERVTAQANAYAQANTIRSWVLKYLPDYPGVVDQTSLQIRVNSALADWGSCPGNARYEYSSDPFLSYMEFCAAGTSGSGVAYSNFAFAGIIEHEYGHHVVAMGTDVKSTQGPYGEGIGDTLEALFHGQHGHSLGGFLDQCDRSSREAYNRCQYLPDDGCSDCGSEEHDCGQLVSGTIWDMRENLKATHPTTYEDLINNLVLSSIQMNKDAEPMNSNLAVDFLTLDDDDGNVNNGTPHYNEICSAFALHGMTCPFALTVTPSTPFFAEGSVGGTFGPASVIYTIANLGPKPSTIPYQVTASPAVTWLTIAPASGSLECHAADDPNAPCIGDLVDVTLAIDQTVAKTLGQGEYNTVLKFTNPADPNHIGDTTRAVRLLVGLVPIYTEDFEGGLGSFGPSAGGATTGLWHPTAECAAAALPSNTLAFDIDASCEYDNGQPVAGTATSKPITIAQTSPAKLRFKYYLMAEHVTYWDQASVQISVNGGDFTIVASNNRVQAGVDLSSGECDDLGCQWQSAEVDLAPYLVGLSSPTVRVRFAFDSVDALMNGLGGSGVDKGFLVDDVQILALPPVNQAPVVNAGPDQTVLLTPPANLAGTVTDDGLPNPPGKVTIGWTKVSGPGTVTFGNSKVASTTATFSKTGTYVLRLTANDSALSKYDDVTVTVTTNQKPVVNAGPDQTVALSVPANLAGTATDDGFPKPPSLTTTWTKTSGPGTVTFANKNALSTTATFSVVGTYVLRLTASDGALSAWDEVSITVSTPCAGLCSNPTKFTMNGSYQSGELGTGAVCRETTSVLNGGNCGNFVSPRVLKVNGTTETCNNANWASVPAKRNGGYCIQATTGQYRYAYFAVW